MLHSEHAGGVIIPLNDNQSDDDDDDDYDCLVANETLQISAKKSRRLTSPPPVTAPEIRKSVKRGGSGIFSSTSNAASGSNNSR